MIIYYKYIIYKPILSSASTLNQITQYLRDRIMIIII